MTTWVKEHFSGDASHSLTTLVWAAGAAGIVGFALVVAGVVLAR
jgi:hypothetical protein